jgi:general stress protein 26
MPGDDRPKRPKEQSVTDELELLYGKVEDLEIAMMTTTRADGHLESRAMATQKRATGAELWFVSARATGKCATSSARPAPVVLFELVKGFVSGDTPELGETHRVVHE